ncbi:MerR family transcriptional regulator [Streptomyces sp. AM 3-1-1]|uniref:MerR family transcriptional regulator n=1 Tax=Streptomyces sp. AM 3-1-1 TaxID=3028711 RepID=UPI0023BA23BD|nr:MerR family transcriptional regulator [Streptomyces sp. AM 3-1-1]WEH28003.1 MerR family transcriptional regulator [Streptomyces sp. AM 3-1-1]
MSELLSIGDFARATHLSVKALRHYQEQGLLEPARTDAVSGYRRYDVAQIPTAQIIHRFRDLDMPLADIREILRTPDPGARNALIARHLRRLEDQLARTHDAVTSLRDLLEHPEAAGAITHRRLPARRVAAVTADDLPVADIGAWYHGALGELFATLASQGLPPSGPAGGVYDDALFTLEHGRATVYVPVATEPRAAGRVRMTELPPAELAVITHEGPETGIDRAYGTLATYVTRHALAVAGPIHEFYPVTFHDTPDPSHWRTQIGWPVFTTTAPA